MSYKCEVRVQVPKTTLTVRTRTPVSHLPQVLGQAFDEIMAYLGALGEQPAGPPFVVYHNMDMQNLDIEIGFPVSKRLPGKDRVQAGNLPEGRVATCLHTGPYSEIGQAYEALSKWVDENGYQATGTAIEIYLNDPEVTAPDKLQTQIVYPLRAA
ncbi:MAG: GyrI-like domain-containing protein [Anaerolineae bacterium]|nr:GyrI-like domain-containing protein [Anaerolineae bacterium]